MSKFARRVVAPSAAIAAASLVVGGPGWALNLRSMVVDRQGPAPVATSIGFDSVGASTRSICSGDACTPAVTQPVRVTVPTDAQSYQAHVSISLDYVAVGKRANYPVLDLYAHAAGSATALPVLPAKRFLSPGRGSTSVDFWVQNLAPGKEYDFALDADLTKVGSTIAYVNTYRVLTRVDVLSGS